MSDIVRHSGALWIWHGETNGTWHFVTIDGAAGDAIRAHEAIRRLEFGKGRGFGSVKVRATIGASEWTTSVFPSSSSGGFILPVKAAIRKAEGVAEGDRVTIELELL